MDACVSTHAPRAGGDVPGRRVRHQQRFQPTPPRGGRRSSRPARAPATLFQPTPPARGATWDVGRLLGLTCVSTHAPARGATPYRSRPGRERSAQFQPTPPARGATARPSHAAACRGVSTHAPARGATPENNLVGLGHPRFNPRPRAGGDCPLALAARDASCFNPRPRAGGDPRLAVTAAGASGFNPRPRAGGDEAREELQGKSITFQPTPPRGGRLRCGARCWPTSGFQPTPPRGGRPLDQPSRFKRQEFQPTPPRAGGDGSYSQARRGAAFDGPLRGPSLGDCGPRCGAVGRALQSRISQLEPRIANVPVDSRVLGVRAALECRQVRRASSRAHQGVRGATFAFDPDCLRQDEGLAVGGS